VVLGTYLVLISDHSCCVYLVLQGTTYSTGPGSTIVLLYG